MAVAHDAERLGIIYALCDPESLALRYVGKTNRSPVIRLQDHILRSKHGNMTRLSKWLRSLCRHPVIRVLEHDIHQASLNEREMAWIAICLSCNPKLVNGTDGGDGGSTFAGHRHTQEAKDRISRAAKGRDMGKAIAASADARRGKPLSEEHKAKMAVRSRGNKNGVGYSHTVEARRKIGQSNIDRRQVDKMNTPEARAKMIKSLSGRTLSIDHRANISAGMLTPDARAKVIANGIKGAHKRWGIRP